MMESIDFWRDGVDIFEEPLDGLEMTGKWSMAGRLFKITRFKSEKVKRRNQQLIFK